MMQTTSMTHAMTLWRDSFANAVEIRQAADHLLELPESPCGPLRSHAEHLDAFDAEHIAQLLLTAINESSLSEVTVEMFEDREAPVAGIIAEPLYRTVMIPDHDMSRFVTAHPLAGALQWSLAATTHDQHVADVFATSSLSQRHHGRQSWIPVRFRIAPGARGVVIDNVEVLVSGAFVVETVTGSYEDPVLISPYTDDEYGMIIDLTPVSS